MRYQISLLVLALLTALQVGGCVDKDSGFKEDPNAGKSLAQRQQERVKQIQDNPNIPEDKKQAAIGAIMGNGHQTGQPGH